MRRSQGPWSHSVHSLLAYLEDVGFEPAPRYLGIDTEGREMLSLIEGTTCFRPWVPALREEAGLASLARVLRQYHDAVGGFRPDSETWNFEQRSLRPGEVIRHGDVGPWNTIWRDGQPVGLVDWDQAGPGRPIDDVAQLAWYGVPLRDDDHCDECGFESPPDRKRRLVVLCQAYGAFQPEEVVEAVLNLMAFEEREMVTKGNQSMEPWATLAREGQESLIAANRMWLEDDRVKIL